MKTSLTDIIKTEYYLCGGLSPEESVIFQARLVVDQELIAGGPNGERKATWMYQVQGGLIQRAWVLDGRPSTAP